MADPVGDDYLASTSTTGVLSWGGAAAGVVSALTDADWFALTVTAGRTYRVDLLGLDTPPYTLSDPFLTIRQANGTAVGSDDDSGFGLNASVSFTAAAAGMLYAEAAQFDGLGTGTYRVVGWARTLFSANADNQIGTAGYDWLDGQGGNDTLDSGGADDMLFGQGGNDSLVAGTGNDTIDGGIGDDTMVGGDGSDIYYVDSALDRAIEANGVAGVDTVYSTVTYAIGGSNLENLFLTGTAAINGTGNSLANLVYGNTAANLLSGLGANDDLYGDSGNDTLDGGTGADTLQGGEGNDLYFVDDLLDVVFDGASDAADEVRSSVNFSLVGTDVETLTLTGTANLQGTGDDFANRLFGNGGANSLAGAGGADSLTGNGGNDTLDGGTGADTMFGGDGSDTYRVDDVGDRAIEANGIAGTDVVISTVSYAIGGSNLENLVLAGALAINGTGNSLANVLTGNEAANLISALGDNDSLVGNGGSDTLDGGTGNDTMNGGEGSDTYLVDSSLDVVADTGLAGTDVAIASVTWTAGAGVETVTLAGTAGIGGTGNGIANTINGNAGNNALSGLGGADTLNGNGGNDTLDGGTGADTMVGGDGSDTYYVDDVNDKAIEANGVAGIDTVISTVSYAIGGSNLEALVLSGALAINGTGNSLANTLSGNGANNLLSGLGANDSLAGSGGADTLVGGAGADTLAGGTGNDRFQFASLADIGIGATSDRIVDLAFGDKIDLSALDAVASTAGVNDAFLFVTGALSAGRVHVVQPGGAGTDYMVEGDVTGDGVADFQIKVTAAGFAPDATSFIL